MIKQFTCISVFFIPLLIQAQLDESFISHLRNHGLRTELEIYLNKSSEEDSIANFQKARFYLAPFNDSLFMVSFLRCAPMARRDSLFLRTADLAVLEKNNKQLSFSWFELNKGLTHIQSNTDLLHIYRAMENPAEYEATQFPEPLRNAFTKHQSYQRKKGSTAAVLSCLVPGLGKWYAGKPGSFLMNFALCSAYFIQTLESSKKLGNTHPFTIINLSGFGIFYLSGIYGSPKAVKDKKRELKKQFLLDAVHYYH